MFWPKPGQTNLPSLSVRNQLTVKICGGRATFLPIASQCAK
jgi:hypothetical protein